LQHVQQFGPRLLGNHPRAHLRGLGQQGSKQITGGGTGGLVREDSENESTSVRSQDGMTLAVASVAVAKIAMTESFMVLLRSYGRRWSLRREMERYLVGCATAKIEER